MTTSGWELLRLFLHITAATIWVGGQLVLAALVPALRGISPQAPAIAARAFARVAWPAFAVLLVTGAWNAWAVRDELHGSYAVLFASKLVVVTLSGLTAGGMPARAHPQPVAASAPRPQRSPCWQSGSAYSSRSEHLAHDQQHVGEISTLRDDGDAPACDAGGVRLHPLPSSA